MHPELISHFCKPIIALAIAGITYLAESVTPEIPGVPGWLTSLGLPVAFLVAVIYALISTNRALRESEKGRRDDWKNYADKIEDMMTKGNETRERLIRATDAQTNEFAKLADQLKSRPCQK
jgi:hypothetical protein